MEASTPQQFITSTSVAPSGDIVDVAYDQTKYRMAVCSSDGLISAWKRADQYDDWQLESQWESLDRQSLTKVAWAPPEFGAVLAAATHEGTVSFWEPSAEKNAHRMDTEEPQPSRDWQPTASVSGRGGITSLAFAPKQHGLRLAVGFDDGACRFYAPSSATGTVGWAEENDLQACRSGACTSLSWQPASPGLPPLLLTGSQEGAQVWLYRTELLQWQLSAKLPNSAPASDVAWADTLGRTHELVGIACHRSVAVFRLSGQADALQVEEVVRLEHDAPVCQVGWNLFGNALAVSTEDSKVQLWRPDLTGQWRLVSRLVGAG